MAQHPSFLVLLFPLQLDIHFWVSLWLLPVSAASSIQLVLSRILPHGLIGLGRALSLLNTKKKKKTRKNPKTETPTSRLMQEQLDYIEIFQLWMLSLLSPASNKGNEKQVCLLNPESRSQPVTRARPWKTPWVDPRLTQFLFLDSDTLALKAATL